MLCHGYAARPFGLSSGVCAPSEGGGETPPPVLVPSCLTFGAVLARVAHFAGAAVGPIAGQAVTAAPTGAREAGVTHWEREKAAVSSGVSPGCPILAGPLLLGTLGGSCVGVFVGGTVTGSAFGMGRGTLLEGEGRACQRPTERPGRCGLLTQPSHAATPPSKQPW